MSFEIKKAIDFESERERNSAVRQSVENFFRTPWMLDFHNDETRIVDANNKIVIESSEWLSSDYKFRDTDGVWKYPIDEVLKFICDKVNQTK